MVLSRSVGYLGRVLSVLALRVLIIELLFADDFALLVHTEETLWHIVNRFSEAARNFSLILSLMNIEVLYQTPSRGAYSLPQISVDGISLSAVEHFTYLGSVILNDATVSKDLYNRLSKVCSSSGRLSKRVWQSHSLSLSTKIQVYTVVVIPTLLYGAEPAFSSGSISSYLSGLTNIACAPSLASKGKSACQTKKSLRKPTCPA